MMNLISKILSYFEPIQKIMQKLGKPEPKMTRTQVDSILSKVEIGDIFLSYESLRLTSYFIKGDFDHAAIVSSKKSIIEAIGSGVQEVDLEEWLFKKDKVLHLRPRTTKEVRFLAGANSLSFLNYQYDYSFSLNDERVYCSELVYLCYVREDKLVFSQINKNNILPIYFINYCEVV